jgi:hypothetical protein
MIKINNRLIKISQNLCDFLNQLYEEGFSKNLWAVAG